MALGKERVEGHDFAQGLELLGLKKSLSQIFVIMFYVVLTLPGR
jgi:hypothetical protein